MMASGPSAALIAVLADPAAPVARQLEVARQLKNLLIGQDLRKELAVRNGLVQPLTDILATATRAYGKRDAAASPRHHHHHHHDYALTPEDDLRLQAAIILGSLAAGGQPFLRPLCAANVPRVLVQVLAADLAPKQVTAVLHALATLASAWAYADEPPVPGYDFWAAVFNAASLETFDALLRQEAPPPQHQPPQAAASRARTPAQLHVQLIADIFASTADDPRCPVSVRALLASQGLIDTLASLLVSYSVAAKHVPWPATSQLRLPPAPPPTVVPSILAAIAAILAESKYRAHCFILSPVVRELFLSLGVDERESFGPAKGFHNGRTSLLPPIWVPSSTSVTRNARHHSTNFPALQILQSTRNGSSSAGAGAPADLLPLGMSDIEHSNAVCGWLLLLARSFTAPADRCAALRLLALTVSAIESDPIGSADKSEHTKGMRERERQLILLAIPLAVTLVQQAAEAKPTDDVLAQRAAQAAKARACETLALLLHDHTPLQVAAVENSSAIKFVCPLLRKTFDSVALAKPMWSARRVEEEGNAAAENLAAPEEPRRMGPKGLPAEILATMRARRAALTALAALAQHKDLHRQAIIDAGVVGCIIDAMKPFPPAALADHAAGRALLAPRDGNTTAVLVAACRAAQALSRSVSVLRTSLVDGGIVAPLVALLRHPDVEVQVAATDVCCNLALTFSPMRTELAELAAVGGGEEEEASSRGGGGGGGGGPGAFVRLLVEHAHSTHAELRYSSLWALKHFVQDCPKELKVATFEELGSGWLVGIIQGERSNGGGRAAAARRGSVGDSELLTNSNNGGVSVSGGGLSAPNAAGEQVDLLNPSTSSGMEVDEVGDAGRMEEDEDEHDDAEEDEDEDLDLDEDEDGEVRYDEASSTHYQDSHMRSTLRASAAASAAAAAAPSPSSHRRHTSFNSRRYLSSMRDLEQSPEYAARRHAAGIQVQALDFLRNLINGEDAAVLHDHILSAIGSAQLYELLHANLLPLPRASTAGKTVYPPTLVVLSTIHLLVHLANPSPRHRALLVAQKPLLQALLPHFAHADAKVRVMAVWVVNSLTWTEDESDRAEARGRILALRALGFEAAVLPMQEDPCLDVRERVKTALRQFERL